LRQIVPSALSFAFEQVAAGTPVEGARLELQVVSAVVRCSACGTRSTQEDFPLACRACGAFDVQIVAGEELIVDELELEEEVEVAHVR
jgi:hydrogenase nickel incorporation protein HypA/HybF